MRLARAIGLIDNTRLVAWVDQKIASLPVAPVELIRLSAIKDESTIEVNSLFDAIPGKADGVAAAHRVLRDVRARLLGGELDYDDVAAMLEQYSMFSCVEIKQPSGLKL